MSQRAIANEIHIDIGKRLLEGRVQIPIEDSVRGCLCRIRRVGAEGDAQRLEQPVEIREFASVVDIGDVGPEVLAAVFVGRTFRRL